MEDTRQPRAYTPHALSDKDELELMAANKDYALVVWSEDERTSPYFLTPELVPEPVHG
ncbi:MAG: hypothetical protein HOV83_34420 [Catenulispora sp.]|nr:hypothetical protein [Catenulispora sp.]